MSTSTPYWTSPDGRHVIYCADCLAVLPHLAGVDAVVTDPVFGIGFAAQPTKWQRRAGHVPLAWDDESSNVLPLLDVSNQLVIWGGNYFPLPKSRGWLVWHKPDAPPSMADAELAWTSFDMNTQLLTCSISSTNAERVGHPTQKPLAVMKWSLSFVTGETILDPYCGSGTTGVACIRTGRRFIGIEVEEKYVKISIERMERELRSSCLPTMEPEAQPKQEVLL